MQPLDDHDIRETPGKTLSVLMRLAPEDAELWRAEELGEILRHQLSAPLEFELIGVDEALVAQLHAKWAPDPPIQTFGDLFAHNQPPIEFLELTKQYAKASRNHPDGPLAEEVAVVLHLLSIVVATLKCGKQITRLDNQGIRFGLQWALDQTWLDESSRHLLNLGLQQVGPQSEPAG